MRFGDGFGDGVKYYIIAVPRKARIDYPGLAHHIMVRTFNDLMLFKNDFDRKFYLSCLSHRIKDTGFRPSGRVLPENVTGIIPAYG